MRRGSEAVDSLLRCFVGEEPLWRLLSALEEKEVALVADALSLLRFGLSGGCDLEKILVRTIWKEKEGRTQEG